MAHFTSAADPSSSRESQVEAFRVYASQLLQVSEPLTLYRIVYESTTPLLCIDYRGKANKYLAIQAQSSRYEDHGRQSSHIDPASRSSRSFPWATAGVPPAKDISTREEPRPVALLSTEQGVSRDVGEGYNPLVETLNTRTVQGATRQSRKQTGIKVAEATVEVAPEVEVQTEAAAKAASKYDLAIYR
jgi:hypothetical protein